MSKSTSSARAPLAPSASRIALGTAQLGGAYGIANRGGPPSAEAVSLMLRTASRAGIRTIDTAAGYGDSERMLGELGVGGFEVITKVPGTATAATLSSAVDASLVRLRRRSVEGCLLHNSAMERRSPGVLAALSAVRADGRAERIGVSVYSPEELEWLLDRGEQIDLVQLPYNVFDRRFEKSFDSLSRRGVAIHIRSVFLQGLFFLAADELPAHFAGVQRPIGELQALAEREGVPLESILLSFALLSTPAERVVVGVDTSRQLMQAVAALADTERVKPLMPLLTDLQQHDENVLLPTRWPP